jgi:cytochrome c
MFLVQKCKISKLSLSVSFFMLMGLADKIEAAFSYAGCTDVTAADFKDSVLVNKTKDPTLEEPVGMSIGKDGRVFFAERASGILKMIDLDGSIKVLATFAISTANELGFRFVSPDPNFATNRWLYLMLAPSNPHVNRLARVYVKPDWTVDTAATKVILDMPWSYEICCHQGGAIDWDAAGNMYVSSGNNKGNSDNFSVTNETSFLNDNQAGTANTMDFRGKILRIKPIAFANSASPATGVGSTYTIPAGNLREFYTAKGYYGAADQSKILPEIFSMGHRNPYTLNLDPYTNILSWGDIGPDAGTADPNRGPAGNDEFNLIKEPGFMGWPYFVGANLPYVKWDYVGNKSLNVTWDVNSPMNTSLLNTGVQKLPPAHPAILPESKQAGITPIFTESGGTAAISGPIYHYDGSNPSTRKFPPHFDGKWIIGEFSRNWLKVATFDQGLTKISDLQNFPGGIPDQAAILGLHMGPDGALYYLNYSGWFSSTKTTKIGRLEYTGKCRPLTPVPVLPTSIHRSAPEKFLVAPISFANGLSNEITIPDGFAGVELFEMDGKRIFRMTMGANGGSRSVALPPSATHGVLRVRYIR